jgi:heptosyltransferase-1
VSATAPVPLDRLGRPPRILVVKTSALGDVVHALPTFEALATALPEAVLGWVVEEPFAPLLAGLPRLETIVAVRLRRWRKNLLDREVRRELVRFVQDVRRFRPDVALDLMGNHKAGVLARLSGARWRVGPRRQDRREPSSSVWINRPVQTVPGHAVDEMGSLLAGLGVVAPRLVYRPEHVGPADVPAPDLPAPYLLVQPGAGWGSKQYPPERWGRVVAELGRRHPELAIGVLAGPGEGELARRVAAAAGEQARVVVPRGMEGLIGVLRPARLVLGGDTGPVHLAHALGRPVLALHGPTDPERHGPWRAAEQTLWKKLPCSFCYRRFEATKACLLEIAPTAVADRAAELLSLRAPSVGSAIDPPQTPG